MVRQTEPTYIGLRIDVDTCRGAREGVPALLALLQKYNLKASFFFSVGPDNSGRQFWRLWDPGYFKEFVRTALAGVRHNFNGALWRGPMIGKRIADVVQETDQLGHEVGLHAWDHHKWMMKTDRMQPFELRMELEKGYQWLSQVVGHDITCSAAAGWRCSAPSIIEKEAFPFRYNSDCRGKCIFIPDDGHVPQIPVTLPTYDELIYRQGVTRKTYNKAVIEQIRPHQLNVYNIHADIEGGTQLELFKQWLEQVCSMGMKVVPLGELLAHESLQLPKDSIVHVKDDEHQWKSHQASELSLQARTSVPIN